MSYLFIKLNYFNSFYKFNWAFNSDLLMCFIFSIKKVLPSSGCWGDNIVGLEKADNPNECFSIGSVDPNADECIQNRNPTLY
jgi:hypothetical protein